MRISVVILITIAVALLLVGGCGGSEPKATSVDREDVALTTFYPLQYFASRIGCNLVKVECPLPPGEDPAYWQPSEAVLTRFQHAALVLVNGAKFERWVEGASLPFARTQDTSAVFASEYVVFDGVKHSHGAQGEHSHQGTDGHTWLDPESARRQAQSALVAMAKRWPRHERAFRDNGAALDADLAGLDARLREVSAGGAVRVFASHPAYTYLARRYGWMLINIDFPPDESPRPEQLEAVRAQIDKARIILFEETPTDEVAKAVESLGCKAVVFSPAESPEPAELENGRDYLKIMYENIDRLGEAVRAMSLPRSSE